MIGEGVSIHNEMKTTLGVGVGTEQQDVSLEVQLNTALPKVVPDSTYKSGEYRIHNHVQITQHFSDMNVNIEVQFLGSVAGNNFEEKP